METDISSNVSLIRQRMGVACARCGRDPQSVRLMAVSKTVAPERIRQALDAGVTLLGENYVQEAREKIPAIGHVAEWHMIGHLQTNKVKYVVNLFDWIHSVDRLELARELDKRAGQNNRRLNVLIEVNVSGEESKSGIEATQALELVRQVSLLPNINLRGLMTMPPYSDNPENSRPYFQALRKLRDDISAADIPSIHMDELSMGMTDDFEVAIEEGATIIRVGRAIFGNRMNR
ncbi:MAG: YggS family pyridoxal phosphate-dependent enzyme [Desulfobacterales bacterium]|nr:YggS family pyridoxal phosphate-dependent enzyme [Desulfobacterales bacterium]